MQAIGCFEHLKRKPRTPCIKCGKETWSGLGVCEPCGKSQHVMNSQRRRKDREALNDYIAEILSWDWALLPSAPQT